MLEASIAYTEDIWFLPTSQAVPPLFPLDGSPTTLPASTGSQCSPGPSPGSCLSGTVLSSAQLRPLCDHWEDHSLDYMETPIGNPKGL